MSLTLTSKRLILRPLQAADSVVFAAYRSDPEVARYQGWEAPFNEQQAAEFIAAMQVREPGTPGEWLQLAIQVRETGVVVGDCAFERLAREPRQAEIGITLARSWQGQGLATEALSCLLDYLFGELELHRVQANCDVENHNSMRLMERLGMRREAHFVENLWFKGRWSSEYWYGILRSEWLAIRGRPTDEGMPR